MSSARKLVTLIFLAALCSLSAKAQYSPAVHPNPNPLQIGVSYTFDNFHELPGSTLNNSGATGSLVYYNDFIGTEAAVTDTFGSTDGKTSNLLFAGGGIRLRYPVGHNFEPWAHALHRLHSPLARDILWSSVCLRLQTRRRRRLYSQPRLHRLARPGRHARHPVLPRFSVQPRSLGRSGLLPRPLKRAR